MSDFKIQYVANLARLALSPDEEERLSGQLNNILGYIEKLKEVLKSIDCKVNEVENLGQKEFSRVVDRKFPSGLYVQFHFEGPVNAPTTFREKLRLDRTINRLLVQVTK